jgi:hypothetical protein
MPTKTKRRRDEVVRSDDISGEERNYFWKARFDLQDGFLGIDQWKEGPNPEFERVLLSPHQVKQLVAFIKEHS